MRLARFSAGLIGGALLFAGTAAMGQESDHRDFWSVNGGIAYAWQDDAFQELNSDEFATYVSGTWGHGPDFFWDWLGLEVEVGSTLTDGEWLGEDWSMQSAAGYLTTRLGSDRFYLKLRGGVSTNYAKLAGNSGSDTGLAGSVGIGARVLGQPLEFHFTAIDADVNTMTLHWQF